MKIAGYLYKVVNIEEDEVSDSELILVTLTVEPATKMILKINKVKELRGKDFEYHSTKEPILYPPIIYYTRHKKKPEEIIRTGDLIKADRDEKGHFKVIEINPDIY